MKKPLLLLIVILVLSVSVYAINSKYQTSLAHDTLVKLSLAENCHDLEAVTSPELFMTFGRCNTRVRFDQELIDAMKTEVAFCVVEKHFSKEHKKFAVEEYGGYSIAFRCVAPEEEGGIEHILLRREGFAYKVVNMVRDAPGL